MSMTRKDFGLIVIKVLDSIKEDLYIQENHMVYVDDVGEYFTFSIEMVQSHSNYTLVPRTTVQESMLKVSISHQFMELWVYHIVYQALKRYQQYKVERELFLLDEQFRTAAKEYKELKGKLEEAIAIIKNTP